MQQTIAHIPGRRVQELMVRAERSINAAQARWDEAQQPATHASCFCAALPLRGAGHLGVGQVVPSLSWGPSWKSQVVVPRICVVIGIFCTLTPWNPEPQAQEWDPYTPQKPGFPKRSQGLFSLSLGMGFVQRAAKDGNFTSAACELALAQCVSLSLSLSLCLALSLSRSLARSLSLSLSLPLFLCMHTCAYNYIYIHMYM